METRHNNRYVKMILGTIPGINDKEIKGRKLPTKRQVILCLLANLKDLSFNDSLSVTIDNVLMHYTKANIPTISGRNNIGKVIKESHDEYMKLMKYNENRRHLDNPGIKKFMSTLDVTMKFYKKSVLRDMESQKLHKTTKEKESIDSDIAFMQSMITNRKASYSGIDKVTAKVVEKRKKRNYDEAFPKRDHLVMIDETLEFESTSSSCDESVGGTAGSSSDCSEIKRQHRRHIKSGEHIFVPHDILKIPDVVAWSVRNNISNTKMNSFIHMMVSVCGGDVSKINLSASSTHRYRASVLPHISKQIKDKWNPSPKMVVHWDGKLMASLDSKHTDDRLPVLVSGVNGIKLLGVPPLPSSTKKAGLKHGDVVSAATKELLIDWSCDKSIVGMVFDTTSSNTGQHTAACVCLQRELDRPLLWLACRRHIGEVMLTDCWDSLKIEASSGPNISIFNRFKNHYLQLLPVNKADYYYPELPKATEKEQESLANFFREFLASGSTRGDYQELVELSLLIVTKGSEPQQFSMKYPGALHKARWMAKLLYTMKMVLLSGKIIEQFPKSEVATKDQFKKLECFCVFAVSVYVQWWIVCPDAANAPVNDLILVEKLKKFAYHNSIIADMGKKALSRHSWYLNEELVPLALFSQMVSDEDKEIMRLRLLQFESARITTDRVGAAFGKPNLKPISEEMESLIDLIGPGSIRFFHIVNAPYKFLQTPVDEWTKQDDFLQMKTIVQNLQVVNEAAERGVKLCHDFLGVTKDEERFQNVLQVVESSRKKKPDQRKLSSSSQEKSWFLALEDV